MSETKIWRLPPEALFTDDTPTFQQMIRARSPGSLPALWIASETDDGPQLDAIRHWLREVWLWGPGELRWGGAS